MKHSIYGLALIAAMAFSSCNNDDGLSAPSDADNTVTFTAQLPAGLYSRSIADGTKATTLKYAAYCDGAVAIHSGEDNAPQAVRNGSSFTLSLPLVKGKTYDFVFWAEATGNGAYTFNPATQSITVSYGQLNDDNLDAFFGAVEGVTVNGSVNKTITLYRPFAQLNIGTDDIALASAAKINHKTTKLGVTGAHTTLNLLTGVASGATNVEVPFNAVERMGDAYPVAHADTEKSYAYLAMAYLLTGTTPDADNINKAQQEIFNTTIEFIDDNGASINKLTVNNVPVQRNYRTNIFGSLLTSSIDWTITIDNEFNKPDKVVRPWDGVTTAVPEIDAAGTATVTTPAEFVGLATKLTKGELTTVKKIELEDDIDLNGYKFDGFGREGFSDPTNYQSGYKRMLVNFDGQGHTIRNFRTYNNYTYASGLFAFLSKGSVVKNLVVEQVNVGTGRQGNIFGVIAGYAEGTTFENITVRNCTVAAYGKIGGIVGGCMESNSTTTFRNCRVEDVELSGGYNVGGLIGLVQDPHKVVIENCPEPKVKFSIYPEDLANPDYFDYTGAISHTKGKGTGAEMSYTLPSVTSVKYWGMKSSGGDYYWALGVTAKWYHYMTTEAINEPSYFWFKANGDKLYLLNDYPVNEFIPQDELRIPVTTAD